VEGLEEADVEDIMVAGSVRQAKTISDVADMVQHLERPGVARAQLTPPPGDNGLGGPVEEAKPHPVTDAELQGAMVCIVVALGVGLGLEESVTDVGEEGVAVLQKSIYRRRARRGWRVRQQCRRRTTINHLERCGAQGGVESGVVAVFGLRKPL